jgi:TPR repeat protein
MHSWLKRVSLGVLAILVLAGAAVAADLASAQRAYKQKDYAAAFKELTPLVKRGDAGAEVLLGRMYLMGHGVLKDSGEAYKLFGEAAAQGNADAEFFLGAPSVLRHVNIPEGLKYLRLSAEQGNQDAQLLLGETYLQGIQGAVPRDPVKADMWLRLAAKNNLPFYKTQLLTAEQQMTPAQIAKGKALAAAWKPQHGLKPGDKPKPQGQLQNAARPPSN